MSTWRRKNTGSARRGGSERQAQLDADRRVHCDLGSPRRDGVTYVEALSGDEGHHTWKEDNDTDMVGWSKVQSKHDRRTDQRVEEPATNRRKLTEMECFSRCSPPTLITPTGPIHVCGQCLCPGHCADECHRYITCQRCGGVGHKAAKYKGERKDMGSRSDEGVGARTKDECHHRSSHEGVGATHGAFGGPEGREGGT